MTSNFQSIYKRKTPPDFVTSTDKLFKIEPSDDNTGRILPPVTKKTYQVAQEALWIPIDGVLFPASIDTIFQNEQTVITSFSNLIDYRNHKIIPEKERSEILKSEFRILQLAMSKFGINAVKFLSNIRDEKQTLFIDRPSTQIRDKKLTFEQKFLLKLQDLKINIDAKKDVLTEKNQVDFCDIVEPNFTFDTKKGEYFTVIINGAWCRYPETTIFKSMTTINMHLEHFFKYIDRASPNEKEKAVIALTEILYRVERFENSAEKVQIFETVSKYLDKLN